MEEVVEEEVDEEVDDEEVDEEAVDEEVEVAPVVIVPDCVSQETSVYNIKSCSSKKLRRERGEKRGRRRMKE